MSYITCFTPVEKAYSSLGCAHTFSNKTNLERHLKQSSCRAQTVNDFLISENCISSKDENLIYTMCRLYGVQEFKINDGVKRIEFQARSAELTAKQTKLYKYPYIVT